MPHHPGRHQTSADACLGFDDALDCRLDRAIIRPRRQTCPEDAWTKPMTVRLTFCQPWASRLPRWSLRPWESPPPMRWRGGTDSQGRMDHRGSSHKLVKSSLMRVQCAELVMLVPMCRTRDGRAHVPNSLRAPGWRPHDTQVRAMLGRTTTDQARTFAPVDGAGAARGSGLMLGRRKLDQVRTFAPVDGAGTARGQG
jgi:hypothetical protein